MKKVFLNARWLWPLFALTALVLFARHDLQQIDYLSVRDSIVAANPFWLALAVLCTGAAVAVMGLYDVICFRQTRLPFRKLWRTGTIAFAWSNFLTVGPLAGPMIRFWLYREDGISNEKLVQGLASIAAGFATGLGLWVVSSALIASFALRVVFVFLAAWILGVLARRSRFAKLEVHWPWFFVVAAADWLIALAVYFFALNAAGMHVAMESCARVFFLGQGAGLISMIPGGLGVADALWVSQLDPPGKAAAALLIYRAIYYVGPWLVATVLLLRRAVQQKVRWTAPARAVIAVLVAASGVILLISSATPALGYRLYGLYRWIPLAALETSHLTSVLTGTILIVLAIQLKKGYRDAFLIAMSLLMVGVVASVLKGLDVEEGWVLLLTAIVLYAHESLFTRSGSAKWTRWSMLGPVVVAIAIFGAVGLAAYPGLDVSGTAWTTVRFGAQAARFLRAFDALTLVGILVAMDSIVRAPSRFVTPSEDELDRAMRSFRRIGTGSSALTILNGDKSIFFGEDDSFSLYRTIGRYMVVFSDPVVPASEARSFTESLLKRANELDRSLVFYQVSPQWMSTLHDFGYMFFKLGEEAIVDLSRFNIRGNKGKAMRNVLNRFQNDACIFRVIAPDEVKARIADLRNVSDAWLAGKGASEKQFSIGYFDESYLMSYPCAVVMNGDGRIAAFANILPGNRNGEYSIDLMRYLPECPNGVMDYLMLNILEWGRGQGYATFNMGMAPLATVGQAREAHRRERLARWLFQRGEPWYNFQGLRQFKQKYDPVWIPRYMAYPRSFEWLPVVAHVTALVSRDPSKNSSRGLRPNPPEPGITEDLEAYTS